MADIADWRLNRELLIKDSEPCIRALLAENREKGEVIVAIGYVFEFGRGQLFFDISANTASNAKTSLAEHLAKWPNTSADEFRWNSGDFDYPAAIGRWSAAWWDELCRLDRLAADKKYSKIIHDGIADICCEVLAEFAKRGMFGDWSTINFNVATLLDEVDVVMRRDAYIRTLIKSPA